MTPQTFVIGFNTLLVALVFHFVPVLRKRSLFFGVTVPDAFRETETARAISRTYRLLVWSGAAGALVLLWLSSHSGRNELVGLTPLLQVSVGLAAWVLAWRRSRPHATAFVSGERTVALGEPEPRIPGGTAALLAPFAGPAAAAWHLYSRYDKLPALYPIHWNFAGEPDRFAEKSFLSVFFPPLMCAALLLLLAVIALAILYGGRRGTSGERPEWSARHRRLNLLTLVSLMWILSAMWSVTSFGAVIPPDAMRVLVFSGLGSLLLVLLSFGIPLMRLSMEATGGTDATPDECWRWGTFYYNPNDPALIVEKRDGPGFTLNFGNRLSWGLMLLILLIAVAPVVVAVRL
jgi:uncharacterized membrane protein